MSATQPDGGKTLDEWQRGLEKRLKPWEEALLGKLPPPMQREWRKVRASVGKDKKHPTPTTWDDDTVEMRLKSIITATRAATRAGFPPGSLLDLVTLEVFDGMLVVLAETCGPHTRALIIGAIRTAVRALGHLAPAKLSRLITELQNEPRIDKSDRICRVKLVIVRAMAYCRIAQYGIETKPDRAAHRARRAALVAAGAQTAFRLGELWAMQRKDVRSFGDNHLILYSDESASKEFKAGREEMISRYVPEILDVYLRDAWPKLAPDRQPRDGDPLWVNRGGMAMDKNAVCAEIRRASRFLVGVELSCNLFRRFYADLDDDREAGRKLRNTPIVRYKYYSSRLSAPETARYQERRAQLAALGRSEIPSRPRPFTP